MAQPASEIVALLMLWIVLPNLFAQVLGNYLADLFLYYYRRMDDRD